MHRRQNFQTIAWFNDLFKRKLLDLDPPYQRRSVWTQSFRDYFIDTILLQYPAPTIFLYEEITNEGVTTYNVVDGKQRLTTIFSFINGEFPVSETAFRSDLRGTYFNDLSSDDKNRFWSYTFSVEYLPTKDETVINNIFDRINRNVAKLTPQELRHAKFSGDFISLSEELTDWMFEILPNNFPQLAKRSKAQMKDIEMVSQILLMIEQEPKGYSTDELDVEFSIKDESWENKDLVEKKFKEAVIKINDILENDEENILVRSRLKNQADFYSLVGAIDELIENDLLPSTPNLKNRLIEFVSVNINENSPKDLADYYEYVRAASNRTLARKERERILKKVLQGEIQYS